MSYGFEAVQQASYVQFLIAAARSVAEASEATFDFTTSCPRPSRFVINLPSITWGGRLFELNKPVAIILYEEDGLWYSENEELNILASGDNPAEAGLSFCEHFSVLWDEIAQCDAERLTDEAQLVKKNFLSLVRAVVG